MNFSRRPALLALILFGVLAGGPRPASAQITYPATNFDPRYATWDTTLVRDTLGLTFERLFPLADSLNRKPEDLKLMSVTYRWTLGRLVKMADSLDQPIDSVGPIMDRERFNPLANVAAINSMQYVSTFAPAASGNSWTNDVNYNITRGKLSSQNHMTVQQQQNGQGGRNGSDETRTAQTALNWRFSPRMSAGGSALATLVDNIRIGGVNDRADRTYEYSLTTNGRPAAIWGVSSTFYSNLGISDITQITQTKRGFKLDAGGTARFGTSWFTHDLRFTGTTQSYRASVTDPNPTDDLFYPDANTRDGSTHLAGTLTALRGRPVELNVNYQIDNNRVHNLTAVNDTSLIAVGATTDTTISPHTNSPLSRTDNGSINAQVRIAPVSFGNLDLAWKAGNSSIESSTLVTSNNSGTNQSFTAGSRLQFGSGINLQGNFLVGTTDSRYPARGYLQNREDRKLNGTATILVGSLFTVNLDADIELSQLRYSAIGTATSLLPPNDFAEQYYKIGLSPAPGPHRMTNTLSLKVDRQQSVNLLAASTASNRNGRTYTAFWSWSYLLLPGMSANQTNTLVADYTAYPFSVTSNRASLSYSTLTTIDANLGPRCKITTTHTATFQPQGSYRPRVPGDPTEYLSLTDETKSYILGMNIDYTVISPLTLNLQPNYSSSGRNTSQTGTLAPLQRSKTFTFSFGATLNVNVGGNGRLVGSLSRRDNSSQITSYSQNGIRIQPTSTTRSLSGTLTYTLTL